jgi:hypothetical protein
LNLPSARSIRYLAGIGYLDFTIAPIELGTRRLTIGVTRQQSCRKKPPFVDVLGLHPKLGFVTAGSP